MCQTPPHFKYGLISDWLTKKSAKRRCFLTLLLLFFMLSNNNSTNIHSTYQVFAKIYQDYFTSLTCYHSNIHPTFICMFCGKCELLTGQTCNCVCRFYLANQTKQKLFFMIYKLNKLLFFST